MNSVHEQLETNRKPRVHIKYEVETEEGCIEKELPFVIGVMGDFTGNSPGKPLKPLSERKFIQVDRDNFDTVMQRLSPGVRLRVENTLAADESETVVNLQFNSLEDFEPTNIVAQVPQLKKLMNSRNKLHELLSKAERSCELEDILENLLQDSSQLKLLADQLNISQEKK